METLRNVLSFPRELAEAIRNAPQAMRELVPAYATLMWMVCGFGMMIEGEISKWIWRLGLVLLVACVLMGLC